MDDPAEVEPRFLGSEVSVFYRGRTDWSEWKNLLLACIFHRRFRLAARILRNILHNLSSSQDSWIWRVILVVLANIQTTDDVHQQFFKMLYFTKSPDYDDRRLYYFFTLAQSGRTQLALDFLEKDMPKKMKVAFKPPKGILGDYTNHMHAVLQIWRAATGFYKADPVEGSDYSFKMLPNNGNGGIDVEKHGVEKEEALMQAGGSEMMSGTNLEDIIALCRCAVKTSGLWDPMIKWLVEILEKTGAASTLQTVLEDYQQQNPSHPMAHKYLLEHYLKHHPNDIALRLPILHALCSLVPHGSHITRYCADSLKQEQLDGLLMIPLVWRALGHAYHKFDSVCWRALAWLYRMVPQMNDPKLLSLFTEASTDSESWWKFLHFRDVSQMEEQDSRLLTSKVQVCIGLYGNDHEFVYKACQHLPGKKIRKIEKSRAALDTARKRIEREKLTETCQENNSSFVPVRRILGRSVVGLGASFQKDKPKKRKVESAAAASSLQKKRGRSKKLPEAVEDVNSVQQKKRGRPKKVAVGDDGGNLVQKQKKLGQPNVSRVAKKAIRMRRGA